MVRLVRKNIIVDDFVNAERVRGQRGLEVREA